MIIEFSSNGCERKRIDTEVDKGQQLSFEIGKLADSLVCPSVFKVKLGSSLTDFC